MPTLQISIPTKLAIHANCVTNLMQSRFIPGYNVAYRFLPGKSNIDQARSMLVTEWYDNSNDDDVFLFIDSDQTFAVDDIIKMLHKDADVICGAYKNHSGLITCRPLNPEAFSNGTSDDLFYGATGFMMIRRPILTRIIELIKMEHVGIYRFYVTKDFPNIIPFFCQRLIASETQPNNTPEWLGEDYGFCWLARKVGGVIKGYISPSIGHEIIMPQYFNTNDFTMKVWNDKSIVWYTGASNLQWSPNMLESGIGGSETAVIYLSKIWTTMGYNVTVYGNVVEGNYDGVEYLNFIKFGLFDVYNTLILWRGFGISAIKEVKAKKILVDLHDIPTQSYQYLLNYLDKVDHLFVRSEFHKNLFPPAAREKAIVIQNGIPDYYFDEANTTGITKIKNKLIYASSYDRGLIPILKWGWPIIRSKIPNAELHIYYGMQLLPQAVKDILIPLLQQDGIFEHGRVSQKELMERKKESVIHYYLGSLDETDCISVKESTMVDVIPVVSNLNVFTERDYCIKVNGPSMGETAHKTGAEVIVNLLSDPELYNKYINIIRTNRNVIESWTQVAQKWISFI